MNLHPFADFMFRIQITETPVLNRSCIKFRTCIHIFKRNCVFSVISLFNPRIQPILLTIIILRGKSLIKPCGNTFQGFHIQASMQLCMSEFMCYDVDIQVFI